MHFSENPLLNKINLFPRCSDQMSRYCILTFLSKLRGPLKKFAVAHRLKHWFKRWASTAAGSDRSTSLLVVFSFEITNCIRGRYSPQRICRWVVYISLCKPSGRACCSYRSRNSWTYDAVAFVTLSANDSPFRRAACITVAFVPELIPIPCR